MDEHEQGVATNGARAESTSEQGWGKDGRAAEDESRCRLKHIATALLAAQKAIQGVAKDASNAGGTNKTTGKERASFDYVSVERMVSDARAALHSAGLALMLTSSTIIDQSLLHQKWLLLHAESGEERELESQMPIVITAGRPPDWATGAASSYGLKYLLRDLLQIPRGLDAEGTDNSDFDPDAIGEEVYQREIKPLGVASGMSLEKLEDAVWAKHPELRDQHPSRWPKALLPGLKKWLSELAAAKTPQAEEQPTEPVTPPPAGTKTDDLKKRYRATKDDKKPVPFV